jgi:hypothetical protein
MPRINIKAMPRAELILYGVGALAGLYVIWQVTQTAKKAAAAVGDGVAYVGHTANTLLTGTVGGLGSFVGLPTPGQTIDDPYQVRWIIDHQGHLEASKWGTALAFMAAEGMAPGSGRAPSGWTAGSVPADQTMSNTGTATVTDPETRSFNTGRAYDPFDPGNYSTGSIFDIK